MTIMFNRQTSKPVFLICLIAILFGMSGCQKILDSTVNNIPFLSEGSKVKRYSGEGKLGKEWSKDGQCQVLLDWVSKVEEEYPELEFGYRGAAPPVGYYANLFRDSNFVPVFGTPYKKMDKSTKTQLWRYTIFNDGCIGHGRFKKYQEDFEPYQGILGNAFNDVSFGWKQIAAAVEEIHREEKQMEEAWGKIRNASMTSESYQELLVYAKPNKRNIKRGRGYHNTSFSSLWPSEAEAFHTALDSKLKIMATTLGFQEKIGTPSKEERAKRKEEFMERFGEKTVPNNKPYWTSESGDTVVKMGKEPWCIKGSPHAGSIEVNTSDPTLYDENNPRLQNIFVSLSTRISHECPGMKELVLKGNFNKEYVFYAWVAIKNDGRLHTRVDVKKDQRKRTKAQNKVEKCKAALPQNPWEKTGKVSIGEPNRCQMLLAVSNFMSLLYGTSMGNRSNCSLLDRNGCFAGVEKDYVQVKISHFNKGICDKNGDCSYTITYHCENFLYCVSNGIVSGLPHSGKARFSHSANGTWFAGAPSQRGMEGSIPAGLPIEELCPDVVETIRCPPKH